MKYPDTKWPKRARGCHIPIYGGSICMVNRQEDYDDMKKWSGVFDAKDRAYGGGVCSSIEMVSKTTGEPMGRPIYLMGVFDGTEVTLAHELIHICFFILDDVGVVIQPDGPNEAFAYLHTYLMSKLRKHLKKPVPDGQA